MSRGTNRWGARPREWTHPVAIASRVGGNPELVTPGETGLLFTSGDEADLARQLELAIADQTLRERLGAAAARKIVNGFSLELAGRAMEEVYVGRFVHYKGRILHRRNDSVALDESRDLRVNVVVIGEPPTAHYSWKTSRQPHCSTLKTLDFKVAKHLRTAHFGYFEQ